MHIFETVCEHVRERNEKELRCAAQHVEYWNGVLREDLELLTKVTNNYILTGIADVQRNWGLRVPTPGCYRGSMLWSTYFRYLAKEMRRPFVFTTKWSHTSTRELRIEKRSYTEPLIATFVLLADTKAGVRQTHGYTTAWRFAFDGEEGEAIFQDWKQRCQKDRALRLALRLSV
jgi:hypothetical protein